MKLVGIDYILFRPTSLRLGVADKAIPLSSASLQPQAELSWAISNIAINRETFKRCKATY